MTLRKPQPMNFDCNLNELEMWKGIEVSERSDKPNEYLCLGRPITYRDVIYQNCNNYKFETAQAARRAVPSDGCVAA